jgi:hypothetical protein
LGEERGMTNVSMWVGAGVIGAGVSAALLTGAGVAGADSGSAAGKSVSSASASPGHGSAKSTKPTKPGPKARLRVADADVRAKTVQTKAAQAETVQSKPGLKPASAKAPVVATASTPSPPSPVALISGLAFGVLSALERAVTGPPAVPPGSTVTVQTSSLKLTEAMTVEANWYFPDGDDPPDRMILLQHGFLANGAMYSYTAAQLAQDTHSIVVTPTLTSNFFADGGNGEMGSGLWLGGDAMGAVVADLFVGDRAALTASALDAGYALRYGLDPQDAVLPEKFGLAGHSAGGAMVSNVTGYLVDNGAADDLVGVIMLDGVPTGDQLPNSLRKLADYEAATGRYIPFRDIAAPPNLFNSAGNAIQALTGARGDHFDGVVLDGGVHMDSMLGPNPIIQFAAYLIAGFPQQQNPAAVRILMADWFGDWFDGCTDGGDGCADPTGATITIDTPQGPATGAVIGSPAADASAAWRSGESFLRVL